MRLVPEIIMKGNNVDIVQDNFTSVLKLLYFNILPLLKYGCKLFVDTVFSVVSSCCSAPPE